MKKVKVDSCSLIHTGPRPGCPMCTPGPLKHINPQLCNFCPSFLADGTETSGWSKHREEECAEPGQKLQSCGLMCFNGPGGHIEHPGLGTVWIKEHESTVTFYITGRSRKIVVYHFGFERYESALDLNTEDVGV